MVRSIVSEEASKQYRAAFIGEFEGHHTLEEVEEDIHSVEPISDTDNEYTRQRIVASYGSPEQQVQIWLLNETGPLQAFYEESEEWGEPGDYEEVAREVEERVL